MAKADKAKKAAPKQQSKGIPSDKVDSFLETKAGKEAISRGSEVAIPAYTQEELDELAKDLVAKVVKEQTGKHKNKDVVGDHVNALIDEAIESTVQTVNFGSLTGDQVYDPEHDSVKISLRTAKLLMTPVVVINGDAIKPTKTGITIFPGALSMHRHCWKADNRLPDFVEDGKGEFSLYEFTVHGQPVKLLLDQRSRFILSDETRNGYYLDFQDLVVSPYEVTAQKNLGSAILVNSDVVNTRLIEHNKFVNVNVENSILNTVSLIQTVPVEQDLYDYSDPSEETQENRLSLVANTSKLLALREMFQDHSRGSFKNISGRRSSFLDSTVAAGSYDNSDIFRSLISPVGDTGGHVHVRVSDSTIKKSAVKSSHIVITNATLKECQFSCTKQFHHGRFTSTDKRLFGESAILSSPFSYCDITVPLGNLGFIQTGVDEFRFVNYWTIDVKAFITTRSTDEEIWEWLSPKGARHWNHNLPDMEDKDAMSLGILQYVFDTVKSRLKVIGLVEKARKVVMALDGPSCPEYFDVFKP